MNGSTRSLLVKGYTLTEGLKALGISRRTYYRYIKYNPGLLRSKIEALERFSQESHKRGVQMKKVLLKDIVIPAGTVFGRAPSKIEMDDSHFECIVGLSNNTAGSFCYCLDPEYKSEIDQHFTDLKE